MLEEGSHNGSGNSRALNGFVYEPLDASTDSLRLLMLLPYEEIGEIQKDEEEKKAEPQQTVTNESDRVCCELVTRTFASKPKYEAISYTWGQGGSTKVIELNGRPFRVRQNLYDALYHLRSSREKRTIWVDAICINQEDIAERSSQVGIMAFIYSRAQRVLVWLGVPVEPIPEYEIQEKFIRSKKNSLAISETPYWSRLWILQELVWRMSVDYHLRGELGIVVKQREKRHTQEHRLELLMENFKKAQCSEIRDKIFGFLGLAHDCQNDSLTVDYTMSIFDLYANAISFHQSARPLDNGSNLHKIVDRYARLMKFSQLVQTSLEGFVDKEAKLLHFSPNPRVFMARGIVAGSILYIGPTYSEVISSYKADKEWRRNIEAHYTETMQLEWLRRYDQSYSRLLLEWDQERLDKIKGINSTTSFAFRWNADESAKFGLENPPKEQNVGGEPRRFLATEILIGFVPPQAQVGDLVIQFWGCDVAVVVREHGANEYFQIVGRADVSMEKDRTYGMRGALNLDLTRWKTFEEVAELRLPPNDESEVGY